MSKKRKIGADAWLKKNNYRKGTVQHEVVEKSRPKRIKKHHKERAKNGYSFYDWINFDNYACGVIASGVRKISRDGHGYPANMDESEWSAVCEYIADSLEGYVDEEFEWDEEQGALEKARDAMHLFADHLGSFWD